MLGVIAQGDRMELDYDKAEEKKKELISTLSSILKSDIGQCYMQRLRFLFRDGFGCWGKSEVPKLWNEPERLAYNNRMNSDR